MKANLTRRDLLKGAAAAAATFTIIPSGILAKGASPNEKLNIAIIGAGHRGFPNAQEVKSENIVALCDVDERVLAERLKTWPRAKTHIDWRKCLEQKDIDAVVVSTIDHTHAFINVWAMNRGLHVYSEKPLANSVAEARLVRETYLKHKGKIATQMGVQRHQYANMGRVAELIRDGAIGTPQEVRLWSGRTPVGGDFLPAAGEIPKELHWDLWLGPAPVDRAFNPEYIKGGCLNWNRYWDFGSGQIGDMGSHIMDIAWWALDLGLPTTCKCEGSEQDPNTIPYWITAEWDHPANSWRPAVKVYWYDGGKMPGLPTTMFNRDVMVKGNGAVFKGDQGYLICNFNTRLIMPVSGSGAATGTGKKGKGKGKKNAAAAEAPAERGTMTYYKPRKSEDLFVPAESHHMEWVKACKTDLKTSTDFEYSGNMIEHNLLSLVAYRFPGQKLEWDGQAGKAANCAEAEKYINKVYRKGWTLNG